MISSRLANLLQCPNCHGSIVDHGADAKCAACGARFTVLDNVPLMTPGTSETVKADMREFWGKGYEYRFSEFEKHLTPDVLREQLRVGAAESASEQHFIGHEITAETIKDKLCLEIGCGGGGHSLILGVFGAEIVATDLCVERTLPAARKIAMLGLNGDAVQADAEFLPFKDGSFDVVFSQGVLHHTPRTDVALAHVLRVLKPGGKAYIGLYARNSFMYYVTEWFYMGVLRGNLFRYGRNWLSAVTEMAQVRPGGKRNPITKAYSVREVHEMLRDFSSVTVRQTDFSLSQIPLFERLEKLLHPERYAPRAPRRMPNALERTLSPWLGWSLYITATK